MTELRKIDGKYLFEVNFDDELDLARKVVGMVGDERLREVLHCADQSFLDWRAGVVDRVIAAAQILEESEIPHDSPRAYCPLCGNGPSYRKGYAIPLGLSRHLDAWAGDQSRCDVMRAAVALARSEHRRAG
jgi:hypothetical protein